MQVSRFNLFMLWYPNPRTDTMTKSEVSVEIVISNLTLQANYFVSVTEVEAWYERSEWTHIYWGFSPPLWSVMAQPRRRALN